MNRGVHFPKPDDPPHTGWRNPDGSYTTVVTHRRVGPTIHPNGTMTGGHWERIDEDRYTEPKRLIPENP